MTPLAAAYVRVSKEARDNNTSVQGMVDDILALAASLGYHVPVELIFIDDGISGAVRDRPEFQNWLEAGRSGKVSAMLCWHADRLTREGVNVAGLILDVVEGKDSITGKLTRRPVRLVDCKGCDSQGDSTAFRFQFVIAAEIARAERERIKDRNQSTKRRLRESRRFPGGRVPFGYVSVPLPGGGRGLEVDPVAAVAIRGVMERIFAGSSLNKATVWMNEHGAPPPRATGWSWQSLRAVLLGQAILGRMSHKGVPLRDESGMAIQPWDAIITPEESARLHSLVAATGKGPGTGRRKASKLLIGIVVCAHCQETMVNLTQKATTRNAGAAGVTYSRYVCRGVRSSAHCKDRASIAVPTLDTIIEGTLLNMFGNVPVTKRVAKVQETVGMVEVEQALRDLSQEMIQPGADLPKIMKQVESLQKQREELAAMPAGEAFTFIDTGKTVGQLWAEGDMESRREVLRWALDGRPIEVRRTVPPGQRDDTPPHERITVPWREDMLTWFTLRDASRVRDNVSA